MKIGFAVLGRILRRHDAEAATAHDAKNLLVRLATRHPEVDFAVFSPCRETPVDLPNVSSPWGSISTGDHVRVARVASDALAECEAAVIFVSGHTSVSVSYCPKLNGDGFVKPLEIGRRASAATIAALNAWQDADPKRDPVWVVNDPRAVLISRDLKWPPRNSIIAQFTQSRRQLHFRYDDPRTPGDLGYEDVSVDRGHWNATHRYVATDLPLLAFGDVA